MNSNKAQIICIVTILFMCPVFSQVIDYSDSIITSIHKEYIKNGLIPPFYAGPLLFSSVQDASNTVSIDTALLSNTEGIKASAFVEPMLHLFSQHKTIEDTDRYNANNAIDYTKNFLSIPPLLGFSIEYTSSASIGGGVDFEIRPRFLYNYFVTNNFNIAQTDLNFVKQAYIYYDNPNFQVLFGRVNTQMGYPHAGSVLFNNEIPFSDIIRINIPFTQFFNIHWQVTNIPSAESYYQKDVSTGNDFKDEYFADPQGHGYQDYFYGFQYDDFPSIILSTFQRLGFQNDSIKAGIAFNAFLVRRNNRFEFADFFPFADWHSTDVTPNNISVALDFGIVPTENILLDFQIAADEFNAGVFGIDDTQSPTIWSARATMQNTLELENMDVFFSTNVGYAHYLYGNFSGYTVDEEGEVALIRALYRYNGGIAMYMPYTSPYGPGALWASHKAIINFANASNLRRFSLEPETTFLLKEVGTNLVDTIYEVRSEKPNNLAYFVLELPVTYEWRGLKASASPSFHLTGLAEPTTTWFELKLSLRADFSVSIFEEDGKLTSEYVF